MWKKQAESEARIGLLNSLVKEGIGLAALEKFQISVEGQFKSRKFKKQSKSKTKVKILAPTMKAKLADEQCLLREIQCDKTRIRRHLEKRLGKTTREYKKNPNDK